MPGPQPRLEESWELEKRMWNFSLCACSWALTNPLKDSQGFPESGL